MLKKQFHKKEVDMFVSRMNEKKMLNIALMAKKAIQEKKSKKSSSRYELEMFDIKLFTKFFIPFCRK